MQDALRARTMPGRVLVVDDNATNRRLLAALLAADGQTVVHADSARAAMVALRAQPFDVVLLDIMMPDVDGFAMLAQVRADPALAETPVVMVSALHDIDSLVRAVDCGACDYLTKPVHASLLRSRVRACIERSQARVELRRLLGELQQERDRAETLLYNILPPSVVERLKHNPSAVAESVKEATVVFVDVVGFTALSTRHSAEAVVLCLNQLFGAFDQLAVGCGIEKIKTIGDAYLAVAGVPEFHPQHAETAVRFANAACARAQTIRGPDGRPMHVRAGVHCGPLVAGVVGTHKYAYDVWGDVVNTAARLQTAAEPDRVLLSDDVRARLSGRTWHTSISAEYDLKGKGRVSAAYLIGEVRA